MSTLRSFFAQAGASVTFHAPVERFLGLTAMPDGLLILTECSGEPPAPNAPQLLGPNGLALPDRSGPEWRIDQLPDGAPAPAGGQFLGGVGVTGPQGRFAIFVYASRVAAPADAVYDVPAP